jgi:hypothetical protein
MRTGIARLLVVALLGSGMASMAPIVTAPVLADCAEHGRSVRTPKDAQGLAFIGVYDTQGDTPDGNLWVRFTVEQPLRGDIEPGPLRLKTFVCDPTLLLPGVRYVLSTSARPGHGMTSYANSIAWAIDGSTATLQPFVDLQAPPQPDQDEARVPLWARQVGTVRDAVALVAPAALDAIPSAEPLPVVPTIWCADEVPPWLVMRSTGESIPTTLDCEAAVAAALATVDAPSEVLRAEFHRGSLCVEGAICTVDVEDRGFVVLHTGTVDHVVGIEANADGGARVLLPPATPQPMASPAP